METSLTFLPGRDTWISGIHTKWRSHMIGLGFSCGYHTHPFAVLAVVAGDEHVDGRDDKQGK